MGFRECTVGPSAFNVADIKAGVRRPSRADFCRVHPSGSSAVDLTIFFVGAFVFLVPPVVGRVEWVHSPFSLENSIFIDILDL